MRLQVRNLGNIREGDIELTKLTIVTGDNNTGKTYLAHTLFGLLSYLTERLDAIGNSLTQDLADGYNLDIEQVIGMLPERLETNLIHYVDHRLHLDLAATEGRFNKTKLFIKLNVDEDYIAKAFESHLSISDVVAYSAVKVSHDRFIRIKRINSDVEHIPSQVVREWLSKMVIRNCLSTDLRRLFIASIERSGAAIFRNELNLTKNRLMDVAFTSDTDYLKNPIRLLEELQKSSYPLPIRYNLDFLTTLGTIQERRSEIAQKYPEIIKDFSDLMGGGIAVDKNSGNVTFSPSSSPNVRLGMPESSSSVRSLVIIACYLKHLAAPGDMLIVDEPEQNLHPSKQRRFAQLLARLVNAGLNVFITTHSDYIVREINSLILLKGLDNNGDTLYKEHGYSHNDLLDVQTVSLYTIESARFKASGEARASRLERVRIRRSEITQCEGIADTTFNKTIMDMNNLQYDILSHAERGPDGD